MNNKLLVPNLSIATIFLSKLKYTVGNISKKIYFYFSNYELATSILITDKSILIFFFLSIKTSRIHLNASIKLADADDFDSYLQNLLSLPKIIFTGLNFNIRMFFISISINAASLYDFGYLIDAFGTLFSAKYLKKENSY